MMSAPQKAGQKPSVDMLPPVIQPVNISMRALMTKVKRPKVMMVRGHERNCTIGFIKALTKPKTAATRSKPPKLVGIESPETTKDATHKATALIKMRIIIRIMISPA